MRALVHDAQNATQPSKPAPSATTSATLDEPPSRKKAAPSDEEVVVADADGPAPVAVPVPVPPEMPVGSLGWSAVLVLDSELRLLSVAVTVAVEDLVAVSATEVEVKVMIGPPGLVSDAIGESESVVSGIETAAASSWLARAAEGARRKGR
jgi:hypothetical protein